VPLPKADDSTRLGFNRTVLLALCSAIGGLLFGFIWVNAFTRWTLLKSRFGWVLAAVGVLICVATTHRRLGPRSLFDLTRVTQSAIPAWKHPAIWSFALFIACAKFGSIDPLNRLTIAHGAKSAALEFVLFYAMMVVGYWALTPSRWEREA
jgi:hypothetical protein